MSLPFLEQRILICIGTGGVGKTTLSASLALRAAQEGKKVLIYTMDPSKRLASCLGLENWIGHEIKIKEFSNGGELWAAMIEPKKVFDRFVRAHAKTEEDVQKMLNNRLYQELSTSLSGSQEFTSLYALNQAYKTEKFDLIILDTPPAQHTLDFLQAPESVFNLFRGPIVEWFSKLTQKRSGIMSLLNKGTDMVIGILEKLTGAKFLDELQVFFLTVSSWRESIQQMVIETHEIMSGEQTQFLLITNLDDSRIFEAQEVIGDFKKNGIPIHHLVFNRVMADYPVKRKPTEQEAPVALFYEKWKKGEQKQIAKLLDLEERAFRGVEFWRVDQIAHSENEMEILETLGGLFRKIQERKEYTT